MDKVDEIYDLIESHVRNNGTNTYYKGTPEICNLRTLCEEICDELNICQKCGAKLKGERNE